LAGLAAIRLDPQWLCRTFFPARFARSSRIKKARLRHPPLVAAALRVRTVRPDAGRPPSKPHWRGNDG